MIILFSTEQWKRSSSKYHHLNKSTVFVPDIVDRSPHVRQMGSLGKACIPGQLKILSCVCGSYVEFVFVSSFVPISFFWCLREAMLRVWPILLCILTYIWAKA